MRKTSFLGQCLPLLTNVCFRGSEAKGEEVPPHPPPPHAGGLQKRGAFPEPKPLSFLLKRYRYKGPLELAEKQLIK